MQINNFEQLLADPLLGCQNIGWLENDGTYSENVPARNSIGYYDIDYNQSFPTYGAKANYMERNRRLSGAYGNAYYGQCNWIKPGLTGQVTEDHFYYLQDLVFGGYYSNLFVNGLTFYQKTQPNTPPIIYNQSFQRDSATTYYRIDILGSEYPYYHGSEKTDVIIQQLGGNRASDKVYVSFRLLLDYSGYHGDYQMRIPITLPVFNDKLYYPQPVIFAPGDDPVDNPVFEPPEPPEPSEIETPYSNFGGDTTDTGPSIRLDTPVDPSIHSGKELIPVVRKFPGYGWADWFVWV